MKRYRVAVIGATGQGDYGHAVDTAFLQVPQTEVVAVADRDAAGLKKAQERLGLSRGYSDYRQMLDQEKPDIVAICPRWIDQHQSMLLAAAEAGCHVYMEKPFCRTPEECDQVVHQFDMRHLKLAIAHISAYSPVVTMVQKVIADGVIGDLLEIRGRGKEDRRGGGEDLWVLGSHIFALMRIFGGGSPNRCFATVTENDQPLNKSHIKPGAEGIGLLGGDHVQATFAFPKSITGHFASRRNAGGEPSRFAIQLYGTKGIIELESSYLAQADLLRDSSWSPGRSGSKWEKISSAGINQPEPRTDGTYLGGHIAGIEDLIRAIEQQGHTKCDARDGAAITEMTAAIFESQRVGQSVSLPLATRVNTLSLMLD